MEETRKETSLLPLEWGGAKVRLECVFLGKTQHFELAGPFARIGSDPRCEISIPGLPAAVCVYVQICKSYVAVLELVESTPMSCCEPVIATQGGTVWLQPNARITVQSIQQAESQSETFSWEDFNVDDIRVFPNTLVARAGFLNSANNSLHFRIHSSLSILGTSPACHLQPKHKCISKFQAILFRGESQGDSCRVVDLFGEHPTLVDNQPAHGQVLEVGSQIRIATLGFEAARFLYNASRPNHIVEVRSQFKSLPFPNKSATVPLSPVAPSPLAPNQPPSQSTGLPDLQTMKDRLVRAIGFDSAASRPPSVHFPTSQTSTSAIPGLVEGLDRVAESQENLSLKIEKLAERIDGMGRSIESIPEIIHLQSQQLVEAIESLRDLVTPSPKDSAEKPSVYKPLGPAEISEKPQARPRTSEVPKKLVTKQQSPPNNPPTKTAPSTHHPKRKDSSTKKPIEKSTLEPSWVHRAAKRLSGWIPYTPRHRRITSEPDEQSESLDLASQSTAKRTRLRQIDHDSELLASNESQKETQVLGSLVGLRYRDARKSYLKWLIFSGILGLVVLIGGPLLWQLIPDGWRELIWQKITFSESTQDSFENLPDRDDTNSPKDPIELETMPQTVPEPLPGEPLPGEPQDL